MSTTATHSRPSHRVYAVTKKDGADKSNWRDIGAMWPHKDGEGFSLKLDFMPLNGAELVVRTPKDTDAKAEKASA